jgi:signal transduction histidine kinase
MTLQIRLFLAFLLIPACLLAQPALQIGSRFDTSLLVGHLARLDSTVRVSPTQLPGLGGRFRVATEPVIGYDGDLRHHYLRFQLQNTGPEPRRLLLTLGQVFFDEADVFVFQEDTLLSTQHFNWQMPFSARPLPHRYPQFLLNAQSGQLLTVVLHIRVSPRQRSSKALLELSDEQTFARQDANELLLLGELLGCCGLMLVFGLIFWLFTRQSIYGFYCGYVFTRIGYVLNVNGLVAQLSDWPGASLLADPVVGFGMLTISTALFGGCYLRFAGFNQHSPRQSWLVINGLMIVLIVLAALLLVWPIDRWLRLAGRTTGFLYLLGLLLALGFSWQYRRGEVLLFAISATPLLLLLLYYLLAGSVFPIYFWPFMIGFVPVVVFELVMLGAGLGWRFEQDRRRAIEARNEAQRDAARHVMQAQEDERSRIAADLHDDLGGTLAALQSELSVRHEHRPDGSLTTGLHLTERAVNDLRLIAHHLMPSAFAEKGLQDVLEEAADLADRQGRARVMFVSIGEVRRLAPDVEINIYRIVREWLTNALRHAQARQIVVQLIFHPDSLYASVEDDGVGLPPILPGQTRSGLGLRNTALRIQYLGATFTSETGASGTLMAIDVPNRTASDQS